jgi:endoglucanase
MISRRAMLAAAGASLIAGPALAAQTAGSTPVERHGRLSVRGNQVVDQHGEPVTLRGMSLFWSQWGPRFYNADAIGWLARDWKASLVRVAVAVPSGGYLEHPARETAKAERAIEAAVANGLYVIVDWHAHDPEPEAAATFFTHIATKYGHLPNIIYEPWNEPLEHHTWPVDVKPYHMDLIPKIRAIDPHNLIAAGTPRWSSDVDVAAADPLPFDNVAYVMHFYATSHGQAYRDKVTRAMEQGAAIFVTEYGTTEATGDGVIDAEETQRWWDFMEANHISYANWSLNDKRESAAALVHGAPANGGWTDVQLTRSGKMVRDQLRRMAA